MRRLHDPDVTAGTDSTYECFDCGTRYRSLDAKTCPDCGQELRNISYPIE